MQLKVFVLATTVLLGVQASATSWLGGSVTTTGFGVHVGTSLLSVPFIGRLGLEGAAEQSWDAALPTRYAAGVTLRDLNIPLTRVDAFATLGAEYRAAWAVYAEAGLRGPLLGPLGWRVYGRGNLNGQFGAGAGLELRF